MTIEDIISNYGSKYATPYDVKEAILDQYILVPRNGIRSTLLTSLYNHGSIKRNKAHIITDAVVEVLKGYIPHTTSQEEIKLLEEVVEKKNELIRMLQSKCDSYELEVGTR